MTGPAFVPIRGVNAAAMTGALLLVLVTMSSCGGMSQDETKLLSSIPKRVLPACTTFIQPGDTSDLGAPLMNAQAVVGVSCSSEEASPDDGSALPQSIGVRFELYQDREAMYEALGQIDIPPKNECMRDRVAQSAYFKSGERVGVVQCLKSRFQPEMTWTDDNRLVLAWALIFPGGGTSVQLYTWWKSLRLGRIG
jgi:hypothetical protein